MVESVAFSPDGTKLAAASTSSDSPSHGVIELWEFPPKVWPVLTGRNSKTLDGHTKGVHSVTFSPDSSTLASGASDGLKLWDVSTGENIATLQESFTGTVAFASDGKILAAGSRDGIRLWDVLIEKNIATFPLPDKTASFSAVFSPDDKTLAVGTGSGKIELWDVKTGKKIVTRHAHGGITFSVVFSPDGKTLASGSQDGTALLWNVSELIDD
jgi:WD40 repeat protein